MALNTELLITLQQLKGVGSKTIFDIANSVDLKDIESLCNYWHTLKGKKFEKVSKEDLILANRTALRIIENCEIEKIGIISYFEDDFPDILKNCTNEEGKKDPPIVLYYRGNLAALKKSGVAIIGTREPTPNGVKAGLYFSRELAKKGYNIISGLAVGCDTTGHRGALDAGGTTTAFLATCLKWDDIYPKENLELAKEIVNNGGLLLSEYYIGQKCGRYAFVARDRLQAGLSYATIVVQTGLHGGTMHAVNATINTGKPLFAVKYNHAIDANHEKVQGNNKMLNDGLAIALRTETLEDAFSVIEKTVNKSKHQITNISLF